MTWKVVQIHDTGYRLGFSLPCLNESFLDDWWCSGILVPASYVFLLDLSHCSYSCDEENQVKKNDEKGKEGRMDDTHFDKWFPCDQGFQL